MKKSFLALIFIALFSVPAFGCLNGETLELTDGMLLYEDYDGFVPYGHRFSNTENLYESMRSMDKGYKETLNINYLSDKGLILIILGKYREAINLYQNIEKLEPGRYSTASNMGTAYELSGDNIKALQWIRRAVQINPDSHYGSEWIHINILKAKLKGNQYITSAFLTGHDFGNGEIPVSKLSGEELFVLRKQLYYQLNERISFVEPKDKIVALLLFDLANISYLMGEKEDALETYAMAKDYGFKQPLFDEKIKLCKQQVKDQQIKKEKQIAKPQVKAEGILPFISLLIFVTVVIVLILFFMFRKRK
jgi:tetratricopeptide (TPR) repeat protein